MAFAANLPVIFWISHIICWLNGTAGSRLLLTWTSASTSLVAASHAVCCSNKSVVKASSSIVSSLLNSREVRNPSDGPSELSSKELEKIMVSEDVSLDTVLQEDELLPEKRQCYFLVSLLYLMVSTLLSLFYNTQAYICGGCQNNVVCYLKCPLVKL